MKGIGDHQIESMYSAYSLPNLCGGAILFGIMIQKWGVCVIFAGFASSFISQVIFGLGVWQASATVMFIGRVLYGAGAESTMVGIVWILKKFVPEDNIVIFNCIGVILSRMSMSFSALLTPQMVKESGSFFSLAITNCASTLLPILMLAIYWPIQARRVRRENALLHMPTASSKPFKCSYMKDYTRRFWILVALNTLVYGIYWTLQPMMRQVLEQLFLLKPDEAQKLIVLIPIVQMITIFSVMIFSRWTKNESWFIFAASFLCLAVTTCLPLMPKPTLSMAYLAVTCHAMYGAIFVSTYSPALAKAMSPDLSSVGVGIGLTANNMMTFVGPIITGAIMGHYANAMNVRKCLWVLSGVAAFGFFMACLLVCNDGWYKKWKQREEEIEQQRIEHEREVAEYGDAGVEGAQTARTVVRGAGVEDSEPETKQDGKTSAIKKYDDTSHGKGRSATVSVDKNRHLNSTTIADKGGGSKERAVDKLGI